MRYSQSAAALVAALSISSVAAGPTRRHVHHHHEKRDNYNVDWDSLDWENMGIDWASAYSAGLAKQASATSAPAASSTTEAAVFAAAAAATTTSAAADPIAAVASAVASVASEVTSDVVSIFNNVIGYANDITAFGSIVTASGAEGDNYYGNYGSPYGHNMMKVGSASGHDLTVEFINTSGKSMSIFVWNKVGSDGQVLSGSALAPKDTALTFALAAGASQVVAFQENSQIGFAQAVDDFTASGAFATTWGECNLKKSGSGYDVSAIMNPNNNNYNMIMTSTEAPACTSDRTQNFWLTETDPVGDSNGSCYIAQSTATITVKMGGTI